MEYQQGIMLQQQQAFQQETMRAQQEFATAREHLVQQQLHQEIQQGIRMQHQEMMMTNPGTPQQPMGYNLEPSAAPGMPSAIGLAAARSPLQDPDDHLRRRTSPSRT